MITPKQLVENHRNIKLTEKSDIESAEMLENRIDNDINEEYTKKYVNSYQNFIPQDFKCVVYLNYFIGHLPNDCNKDYVKLYILEKYSKNGWEIKFPNDPWIWQMKFNLAALRDENIDNLLDETKD